MAIELALHPLRYARLGRLYKADRDIILYTGIAHMLLSAWAVLLERDCRLAADYLGGLRRRGRQHHEAVQDIPACRRRP